MIKSLIIKELNITSLGYKFKKENLINTILELLIYAGFIVIEVYLFHMLTKKFQAYNGVEEAFLMIYLSIISIFLILLMTLQARKSIYSIEDANIMLTKPIKPKDNIISKIIFIYGKNVLFNYFVAFPILISYAINIHSLVYIMIFCILYPWLMAFFETGFACILVLGAEKLHTLFQKYIILQIVGSILIIVGFCYLYSYILNIFMVLVQDGNISTIFTNETLDILKAIGNFCIPIRFFTPVFENNFIPLIYLVLIALGILVLGIFLASYFYLRFIKNEKESTNRSYKKFKKVDTPTKALLKKEAKLIFSSNSIFSFAGLLFMEPILTYAIVKAIHVIFKSGVFTFLTSMYTFIIPIIGIIFVTLFSVIINTSSSFILHREGYNGIKICKLIPISYKKQVLIKMAVPFMASFIALLVSVVVLISFNELSILNGVFAFMIALVLQILMEMICVSTEFRGKSKEGTSLAAVIELISILLPILVVGLMFLFAYLGLPFYISFLIPFVVILIVTILYFIIFSKKINKLFILLETRN